MRSGRGGRRWLLRRLSAGTAGSVRRKGLAAVCLGGILWGGIWSGIWSGMWEGLRGGSGGPGDSRALSDSEEGYSLSCTLRQAGPWLTEMLWCQFYPLEESETAGVPGSLWQSWLQVYVKAPEQRSKGEIFPDPDPSYKKYRSSQTFYEEHEYLAWYGIEESGQMTQDNIGGDLGGAGAAGEGEKPAEAYTAAGSAAEYASDAAGHTYVLEQLMDYDFLMKHFYNVHTSTAAGRELMDARKLLSKDMSLKQDSDSPQILIYHTHSQEAFADSQPGENIQAVGGYLADLLREKGYRVYHDQSVYDVRDGKLDRNKAYNYALEGITKILEENPSIEVVLDLHRDGVGEQVRLVSEINGKPTAQIMFFNGLSQTPEGPIDYLSNPYREDNLAFSLKLQLQAEAYYPGYARKIYLKGLRYNQHLRPRSALIEAGAQTNTYEEVRNAMEPLAELLDRVLQGNQKDSIIQ